MLRSLANLADRVSRSWRLFLPALGCVLALAGAGAWVAANMLTAETGYPAFEAQMIGNPLTAEQVVEQAARYNEPARRAAWLMYALDMLFPFAIAVVQTAMAAWGIRKLFPHRYHKLKPWLPLLFIFVPLDWLENIGYLAVINGGASASLAIADAARFFSQLKWVAICTVLPVVLLLAIGGLIASIVALARTGRSAA